MIILDLKTQKSEMRTEVCVHGGSSLMECVQWWFGHMIWICCSDRTPEENYTENQQEFSFIWAILFIIKRNIVHWSHTCSVSLIMTVRASDFERIDGKLSHSPKSAKEMVLNSLTFYHLPVNANCIHFATDVDFYYFTHISLKKKNLFCTSNTN